MSNTKNRTERKNYSDSLLTFFTVVLTLFSLVMISSANISSHNSVVSDVFMAVIKQVIFMAIAYTGYFMASRFFSFNLVRKLILTVVMFLFIALLSTRLFSPVGGAYAWIRLPFGMSIQPSEFAKVIIILVFTNYLCDIKNKKIKNAWILLKTPVLTTILYAGIIVVIQHDFGSGFALVAIASIVFMIPNHQVLRKWQWFWLGAMVAVVVLTVVLMSEGFEKLMLAQSTQEWLNSGGGLARIVSKFAYQAYRFISARDPLWDRFGYSQELLNSLLGIARGNIRGVGLGNSIQKFGYLASSDADYIFPVIVEELGLLGIALVFIPYIGIYTILIRYAYKVKTEREKAVLIGTFAYLFIHMFLNIGGVTAFIPLTGVPLLMVSRGGSALIAVLTSLGICQNIIRRYRASLDENNSR